MIELGKPIDVELRTLEMKLKAKAIAGPMIGRHRENYTINGMTVSCEQNRRVVHSKLAWVTTWYFNYQRIGFNALVGKLTK